MLLNRKFASSADHPIEASRAEGSLFHNDRMIAGTDLNLSAYPGCSWLAWCPIFSWSDSGWTPLGFPEIWTGIETPGRSWKLRDVHGMEYRPNFLGGEVAWEKGTIFPEI